MTDGESGISLSENADRIVWCNGKEYRIPRDAKVVRLVSTEGASGSEPDEWLEVSTLGRGVVRCYSTPGTPNQRTDDEQRLAELRSFLLAFGVGDAEFERLVQRWREQNGETAS